MTSFWKLCERFPPCLVRMLARHPRGPLLSDEQIAKQGELSLLSVRMVSGHLDWDGIDVCMMRRFLTGCGIDFENRIKIKRLTEYLSRNPKLLYLRNDAEWDTRWKPLIQKWRKIRQ